MNSSISFCKSWFRAKKKPTEMWSEDQARAAHFSKETYTVLVGSIDRPNCFIDIASGVIGVGFLDEFLRESLTYTFQEVESGKLFLTMATYREFEGDTDKVVGGSSYMFEQDGSVKIRRERFSPYSLETATSTVDVSSNYSSTPEFAHYDELIRVERS
ncbi:lytic transglycosylase [Duganella sp. BJB1802]|uniref:lytic transglycosylase n=1 Tax=Duganella sp. BJB1802 TaxID=2744575 RepID=UPI001594747B|nr:lytic transglycosylase [Duganella sp. BJB1802]NVD73514.1 lytic transglycosylase [Duganella sp. BJB1802]